MGGGALVLALLAGPVAAQDFPALYDVAGVASHDVLNIRAAADATAAIVGSFAPDRDRIEVLRLSPDGRWAEVGRPEGNGWVATRFLTAAPVSDEIPLPLRCSGTEPFWTLTLAAQEAAFLTPEGNVPLRLVTSEKARNGFTATLADDKAGQWQVIAQNMQCSDGMSDRSYGIRALLSGFGAAEAGGGPEIYAGCCTLDGG